MRLRITESTPGELLSRAVEAVRVIERITGRVLLRSDLRKADKPEAPSAVQFKYPVLDESVRRSSKEVERIRKLMLAKIDKVLKAD